MWGGKVVMKLWQQLDIEVVSGVGDRRRAVRRTVRLTQPRPASQGQSGRESGRAGVAGWDGWERDSFPILVDHQPW